MKKMRVWLSTFALFGLTIAGCKANTDTPESTVPSVEPSVLPSETESKTDENIVVTKIAFEGLTDLKVNVGDGVNPKEGVKVLAYFEEDGKEQSFIVTSYLVIKQGEQTLTSSFNTQNEGTFVVTYSVDTTKIEGFDFSNSSLTLSATRNLVVEKAKVSSEELITEGDFAQGGVHWASYTDGASVDITYDEGYMKCVETSITGNSYSPRINTPYPNSEEAFTLQYGVTYQLSLDMKSDADKKVSIQLGTLYPASPYWASLEDVEGNQLLKTFTIDSRDWKTYTYVFTLASATCTETHMTFEMGTVDGDATVTTIYLDNVSLKALDDDGTDRIAPQITGESLVKVGYEKDSTEAINVLDGISATDNKDGDVTSKVTYTIKNDKDETVESLTKGMEGTYTVSYEVADEAGNVGSFQKTIVITKAQIIGTDYATPTALVLDGEDPMKKDTVKNKFYYWTVLDASWNCGPAVASTATLDGETLTIETTAYNGNTNAWCCQLFYQTDLIDAGMYKVAMKINSENARSVSINGKIFELVAGDNDIAFVASLAEAANLELACLLGTAELSSNTADKFVISNLDVIYLGANNAPAELAAVPSDEAASKVTLNTWHYWYVADASWNCGAALTSNATFVDNTLTITTSGLSANENTWSSQLFYTTNELLAGEYNVSLKINSSVARSIMINGTEYTLVAGDNTVTVNTNLEANGNIHLAFQLGGAALCSDDASTFVITDFQINLGNVA